MMIGTNVDEMRLLSAGDPHRADLDDDGLRRRLDKVLDGGVDEVIETVRRARRSGAANRQRRAISGSRSTRTGSSACPRCVRPTRTLRTSRARSSTCSGGGHPRSTAGSVHAMCSRSRSCSDCTTHPHLVALHRRGARRRRAQRRR